MKGKISWKNINQVDIRGMPPKRPVGSFACSHYKAKFSSLEQNSFKKTADSLKSDAQ